MESPFRVGQAPVQQHDTPYVPGELLVKIRPAWQERLAMNEHGLFRKEITTSIADFDRVSREFKVNAMVAAASRQIKKSSLERVYKLRVDEKTDILAMADTYSRLSGVEYAQPNYYNYAFFTPNDEFFGFQWHFHNTTFTVSDINLPEAWEYTRGGKPEIVVAVIDTGVAYENFSGDQQYNKAPDLANTAFTPGYDFVNNDTHPNDDHGHGTHVTGTIAQSTDNTTGIAGIAYKTTIMPVKALAFSGSGTTDQIANSIDFARENGADIINMSLGSSTDQQGIKDAVAAAVAAKVVVVAATGNDGAGTISYPAAYDGVIAVGATDLGGNLTRYSNFGAGIDIVAPGGDTSADLNGDGYADGVLQQTINMNGIIADPTVFYYVFLQGTSMASPHVAGVAALLMAYGVGPTDVDDVLYAGARDRGVAGYDQTFGHGLLDAQASLAYVANNAPTAPTSVAVYTDSSKTSQLSGTRQREQTPYFEWNEPQNSPVPVTGYYVYFGTDSLADPVSSGTLQTGRGYNAPSISGNGVKYYLRVKSAGNNGVNSVVVQSYGYIIDTEAAVPTSPKVESTSTANVISWSASADESQQGVTYKIYRSRSENGTYSQIGVGGSATSSYSYTDSRTKVGRKYFYKVSAVDDMGNESAMTSAVSTVRKGVSEIIAGRGNGGTPEVKVFNSSGTSLFSFFAYSKSVKSGVNLATGDLDGDGEDEIITGTGPGGGPQVRVFDKKGNPKFTTGFFAYGSNVRTGVKVAAGDVDGDGIDEIITGTGKGGGPQVRIFDATGKEKGNFFAYDKEFRGGVEVASGELLADGKDVIVTGAGPGGRPEVRVFDRSGNRKNSFLAYDSNLKTGILVGVGDVTGDGTYEIVTGTGKGAGPQVRVFDRNGVAQGTNGFFAYDKNFRGGVFTQPGDLNADGKAEIVTGTGTGGGPHVRMFNEKGSTVINGGWFAFEQSFKGGAVVTVGNVSRE